MCITPITLKREVMSSRGDFTNIVPCGKCPQCLGRRQNAWAFRLHNEMKEATSAKFLTLTYAETPKSFNGRDTLVKKDYQDFMKRLRKNSPIRYTDLEIRQGKKPLKYYACGEYGTKTKRPHYHAIMFNLPKLYTLDPVHLEKDWQKGSVHILDANMATIYYTTKYVMKGRFSPETDDDDREPEFSLMSKKMGLNYLTDQMVTHFKEHQKNYVTMPSGWKQALPRYFKEKIFTKHERQKIADKAREELERQPFKFDDYWHEVQWKRDLIRKTEKQEFLKRNKL